LLTLIDIYYLFPPSWMMLGCGCLIELRN